jgi:hypothetical protein
MFVGCLFNNLGLSDGQCLFIIYFELCSPKFSIYSFDTIYTYMLHFAHNMVTREIMYVGLATPFSCFHIFL